MAIYALNKIAQVSANIRKAHIQFILRDQIETKTAQMDQAFETLTKNLRLAATAAGASLEELIVIPDRAEEIISMFPSALTLENINDNEQLKQTRSSEVFR